jgi:uncharacterized ubiquitin-like protein YukD
MESVLVTIRFESQNYEYDLEIPVNLTANLLIQKLKSFFISKGVNINGEKNYLIKIESQSRILNPDETIEEAGIWDGMVIAVFES